MTIEYCYCTVGCHCFSGVLLPSPFVNSVFGFLFPKQWVSELLSSLFVPHEMIPLIGITLLFLVCDIDTWISVWSFLFFVLIFFFWALIQFIPPPNPPTHTKYNLIVVSTISSPTQYLTLSPLFKELLKERKRKKRTWTRKQCLQNEQNSPTTLHSQYYHWI